MADALTAENKIYVNAEFFRADHAFFCGERQAYEPQPAKQAWTSRLEFLRS
jgi:dienelactone hydrolase